MLEGTLDLPPDVYNGMIHTVAKNLPKGAGETVQLVVFLPKPRVIKLKMVAGRPMVCGRARMTP